MKKLKDGPTVSVIIVNWNGKKWLRDCLYSLEKQIYRNFEIIFVDNNSSDDSVSYVRKNFPKLKIVQNKTNRGFAGGNNDGLKVALGDYILLLNNDTKVEKFFLKNFLKAFEILPQAGCIQSKIVLMDSPGRLDMCGGYWTDSTFLYYFGLGKDANSKKYSKTMPFFSNKGASMMIKRKVIEKIGLFDEDFWNYYEDTDFCHRVWLSGFECWYYPKAVSYHAMGGTSIKLDDSLLQFHNFKNKLLSFLKNFEIKSLLTIIPIYIYLNIIISFIWLSQGNVKHFFAIYKALWWNVKSIKATFYKRRKIQSLRNVSDSQIMRRVKVNPRLSYYFYSFTDLGKYED